MSQETVPGAAASTANPAAVLAAGLAVLITAADMNTVGVALPTLRRRDGSGARRGGEFGAARIGGWAPGLGGIARPAGRGGQARDGGLLISAFSWRSVFLINISICLLAGWLGWRYIPVGTGRMRLPNVSWLVLTCWSSAWPGWRSLRGSSDWEVRAPDLLIAAPLLALAVVALSLWGRRADSRPVVAIVRNRAVLCWLLALLFGGEWRAGFFQPISLLSGALHGSNVEVGFTMLALPSGMVICSLIGGITRDQWGAQPAAPR